MSTYTHEQLRFINYNGSDSVILSAVAGSGKTYSVVGRLNKMLADGVDPSRIILFSFTNDAVEELKNRINADVRITTIHSYTSRQLAKMGKFKPVVTFYDFAAWYKEKFKPKHYDPARKKMEYQKTIDKFYEDGNLISNQISAYKLQQADNVRCVKPKFYDEYRQFLREENKRDFCDMLIECDRLSQNPQYIEHFEGTYDYVFIDEYQDTSTLQLKILLTVKAKQYYLIGDKNQSIYGFSGANCDAIEALLKKHRPVSEFTLTNNFRSRKLIVEHANKFSQLKAVAHSQEDGLVDTQLINMVELEDMIRDDKPLAILVRTNKVIKELEKHFLKSKRKMRYFNYITADDIAHIKEGKITTPIRKKLEAVAPYHSCSAQNPQKLLDFIETYQTSNKFITSIHKSKGREYPRVVVVNSFDPEQLFEAGIPGYIEDFSFINDAGEIDVEAQNVHYVACTRPKEELYFLLYDE